MRNDCALRTTQRLGTSLITFRLSHASLLLHKPSLQMRYPLLILFALLPVASGRLIPVFVLPTIKRSPTSSPTHKPSVGPSFQPSNQPSTRPSPQPSHHPSYQPSEFPTSAVPTINRRSISRPTKQKTKTFITASKNEVTSQSLALGLVFTILLIGVAIYLISFGVRWAQKKQILPLHNSHVQAKKDKQNEDEENGNSEQTRAAGGDEDNENNFSEQALAQVMAVGGALSSFVSSVPSRIDELISGEDDSESESEASYTTPSIRLNRAERARVEEHSNRNINNMSRPQSSRLRQSSSGNNERAANQRRQRDDKENDLIEIHPEEWGVSLCRALSGLNSFTDGSIFPEGSIFPSYSDSIADEESSVSKESCDSDSSDVENGSAASSQDLAPTSQPPIEACSDKLENSEPVTEEKLESVIEEPGSVTEEKLESVTEEPESVTEEKLESVTEEPESIIDEKLEAFIEELESGSEEPESGSEEPVIEKHEPGNVKSEPIIEKHESVIKKSGSLYDKILSAHKTSSVLSSPLVTLTQNPDSKEGKNHFSLRVVAKEFEGLSITQRHRMICMVLGNTMKKIHSLEVKALSPSEHVKQQCVKSKSNGVKLIEM